MLKQMSRKSKINTTVSREQLPPSTSGKDRITHTDSSSNKDVIDKARVKKNNSSAVNRLRQIKHNYDNGLESVDGTRGSINYSQQLDKGTQQMITSVKSNYMINTESSIHNMKNPRKPIVHTAQKVSEGMPVSPYSMLKKQQQGAPRNDIKTDNFFHINPEKLSGGNILSGSLSARERALDEKLKHDMKIINANKQQQMLYNNKTPTILNLDLEKLDQLSDEEVNKIFLKSLEK